MTLWRRQLREMLQISVFRKWSAVFLAAGIVLAAAGCRTEKKETVTLGEWIILLNEKAGIVSQGSGKPYYINIPEGSAYFDSVQAAADWEIIEPSVPFDPDAILTNEWTAYTLMNLAGRKDEGLNMITDLSETMFASQVSAAVSTGLMKVDSRGKFNPKKPIDRDEAVSFLSEVIQFINHREFEDTAEDFKLRDDQTVIRTEPVEFDEEEMRAVFPEEAGITEGKLTAWKDNSGKERLYRAENIRRTEKGTEADLVIPAYDEITESSTITGGGEIDFTAAELYGPDGSETSFRTRSGMYRMSSMPLTKTMTVNGYDITITAAGSSIKAEAEKTLPSGAVVRAGASADNVRTDYRWEYDENHVRNGYFRVSFGSYEHAGLVKSKSEKRYMDFAGISSEDFVGTLKNSLKKKQDVLQESLTLCTLRVPVGTTGAVSLKMKLQLNLYVSGQAELLLSQDSVVGFEIRNHGLRVIKEMEKEADGSILADLKTTAGIYFGLCLADMTLMDTKLNAGTEASVSTTVHLYDDEGNHTVVNEDVPMDEASAAAAENPDVLVCGDLKAVWVADAFVNSPDSTAGKLGFSAGLTLLDGSEQLFPDISLHMENFGFVDKCTRGDRPKIIKKGSDISSERLSVAKYSLMIRAGESKKITVTSIPQGYRFSDLVFASADPTVAEADPDGTVTAERSGSTTVTISTSDGKYRIKCSILVPRA